MLSSASSDRVSGVFGNTRTPKRRSARFPSCFSSNRNTSPADAKMPSFSQGAATTRSHTQGASTRSRSTRAKNVSPSEGSFFSEQPPKTLCTQNGGDCSEIFSTVSEGAAASAKEAAPVSEGSSTVSEGSSTVSEAAASSAKAAAPSAKRAAPSAKEAAPS